MLLVVYGNSLSKGRRCCLKRPYAQMYGPITTHIINFTNKATLVSKIYIASEIENLKLSFFLGTKLAGRHTIALGLQKKRLEDLIKLYNKEFRKLRVNYHYIRISITNTNAYHIISSRPSFLGKSGGSTRQFLGCLP